VSAFIDEHRDRFGVEPICQILDVSASAYYQRASGERSARRVEDERLTGRIRDVHEANYECYGYRRVHAALLREGETAGRDQVARLMASDGIQGAKRRGKPWRTTTVDPEAHRPQDLVRRDFTATGPDRLWVTDFTYLRCWEGRVFFSFVIDVFSRMIVGWQLASHMRTDLVLDALRMALGLRQPGAAVALVSHSDAGSQGGFNRSSQRSMKEGCDGQAKGVGVTADGSAGDAFAGSSACGAAGASSEVLGRGRAWDDERAGGGRGGGVAGGRRPMVPVGWRYATSHPGAAVGALSVVRGAGRDRVAARAGSRRAGDRSSARAVIVDDLA
jgi:putative transposase